MSEGRRKFKVTSAAAPPHSHTGWTGGSRSKLKSGSDSKTLLLGNSCCEGRRWRHPGLFHRRSSAERNSWRETPQILSRNNGWEPSEFWAGQEIKVCENWPTLAEILQTMQQLQPSFTFNYSESSMLCLTGLNDGPRVAGDHFILSTSSNWIHSWVVWET